MCGASSDWRTSSTNQISKYMDKLNEIYRYCAEHIDLFQQKEAIALDNIDRWRYPLDHAMPQLYNEMYECIGDWCDENDYAIDYLDDIDVEEVFWAGPGED